MKKSYFLIFFIYAFLFCNCKDTPVFENKIYFLEGVLTIEIKYSDLPSKDKLGKIDEVFIYFENLKEKILSPIYDSDLVLLEQKDEYFKIQIFNLDSCPKELTLSYRPRGHFIIYIDDYNSDNKKFHIRK